MLEWIKDKGYYRKRANTVENENKIQRETFEEATREWAKQLIDKKEEIEHLKNKVQLKEKTIKELKERNKELESKILQRKNKNI